jgi:hypothetical protein
MRPSQGGNLPTHQNSTKYVILVTPPDLDAAR